MPRYLTPDQIESALKRGKCVEQLLERPAPDRLSWLELRPAEDGVELWGYDVFDDGNEEFLDVYSFTPVEDDGPESPEETYPDATTACAAAEARFSAISGRWVNQAMIQDEYGDDRARLNQSEGQQEH
jgi:hypothetical protein